MLYWLSILLIMYFLTFSYLYELNRGKNLSASINLKMIITIILVSLIHPFVPNINSYLNDSILIPMLYLIIYNSLIILVINNVFSMLDLKIGKLLNNILYIAIVFIFIMPMISNIINSISMILNYDFNLLIKLIIYTLYITIGYLSINYKKELLDPKFNSYKRTVINTLLIITIITLVLYIYWIFMGYGDVFSVLLIFKDDYVLETLHIKYQWVGTNEISLLLFSNIFKTLVNSITIEWVHSIISWYFLVIFTVYFYLKKYKSITILNIIFIIIFVLIVLGLLYEGIKMNNLLNNYFGRKSLIYGWGYIDSIASYINSLFATVILINIIGLFKTVKSNIKWSNTYIVLYLIVNARILLFVSYIIFNFHFNSFILLSLFISVGILGYFLIKKEYDFIEVNKKKYIKYIVISLTITSIILIVFYKVNDINYIRSNFEILKYY